MMFVLPANSWNCFETKKLLPDGRELFCYGHFFFSRKVS